MKHEEQFSFQICGITVAMTSQIIIIATSISQLLNCSFISDIKMIPERQNYKSRNIFLSFLLTSVCNVGNGERKTRVFVQIIGFFRVSC